MNASSGHLARQQRKRRGGHSIVEAAFVLPLVLMFLLGILEYGRWFMTVHVGNNAASEGAAYASRHTSPIVLNGTTYGNGTSDVLNVVNSALSGVQLTGQTISVYLSDGLGNNLGTWTNCAGRAVRVRPDHRHVHVLVTHEDALPAGVDAHDVPGGAAKRRELNPWHIHVASLENRSAGGLTNARGAAGSWCW